MEVRRNMGNKESELKEEPGDLKLTTITVSPEVKVWGDLKDGSSVTLRAELTYTLVDVPVRLAYDNQGKPTVVCHEHQQWLDDVLEGALRQSASLMGRLARELQQENRKEVKEEKKSPPVQPTVSAFNEDWS